VFQFPGVRKERVVLPWDFHISGLEAVARFQIDLDCVVASGAGLQVPFAIFYLDELVGELIDGKKSEHGKYSDC
jgi:hypothetical protein